MANDVKKEKGSVKAKEPFKNKFKKFFKSKRNTAIAIVLCVCLVSAILLPIFLLRGDGKPVGENEYQIPALTLPEDDKYALQTYKYETIGDTQVTVRADSTNILERGVERIVPEILSDDYSLIYDTTSGKKLTAQYGLNESGKYNLTANAGKEGQYLLSGNTTTGVQVAQIDFKKYPRSMTIGEVGAYSIGGGEVGFSSVDQSKAEKFATNSSDYLTFYKYMLFSQCYNLTTEAATRSNTSRKENTTSIADYKKSAEMTAYANWLKKHPAADNIYGRVLGTDGKEITEASIKSATPNNKNAVTKKITVDPIYRSLHATGLYLPAGEPVVIKIEGLKAGETIGLKMNEQDSCAWVSSTGSGYTSGTTFTSGNNDGYFMKGDVAIALGNANGTHNHWSKAYGRLPWIRSMVNWSKDGVYAYGSPLGGVIEIDMKNCYSKVTITISGAVETPHYILGTTTPQYFNDYLRDAPGVVAILDTENGQLIGPTMEMGTTRYMRQVKTEEIDKLAMLWHSFFSINESFTGGIYNRFNKVMFDWLVPAGAAVSMGNYSFAQPTGWFDGCLNYKGMWTAGNWGTLHEIGHNHGTAYGQIWGFGVGREGEVRNNALILLGYIMLCDVGTTIRSGGGAEHGSYANPYSTLSETLTYPGRLAKDSNGNITSDYDDGVIYQYFQCLGMYANIMHSFGAEKYYELMYTYKTHPASYSTNGNKRADFAYRCAITYKMNFIKYFNNFYAAHITDDMFTADQLAEMKAMPNYEVVSNFYAGGIDGVKTAGDYSITFGEDITFDLKSTTISTLDANGEKGFEVIWAGDVAHGSIRSVGNGKYKYSFNKDYNGNTDQFSFKVKLKDGIVHTLTVYLRIEGYNSVQVKSYEVDASSTIRVQFDEVNSDGTFKQNQDYMQQFLAATPENMDKRISNSASTTAIPSFSAAKGKKEVKVANLLWKSPVTGQVAFAVSGSIVHLFIGEGGGGFDSVKPTGVKFSGSAANGSYETCRKIVNVEEGKFYPIRLISYSAGTTTSGGPSASADVYILKNKDGTITSATTLNTTKFNEVYGKTAGWSKIPANQIYHPDRPYDTEFTKYTFTPNYLISKKANINLSSKGTDKSSWKVIQAPEFINGGIKVDMSTYNTANEDYGVEVTEKQNNKDVNLPGHYSVQTMDILPAEAYNDDGTQKDIEKYTYADKEYLKIDGEIYKKGTEIRFERKTKKIYTNMWDRLIDGSTSTELHTVYTGSNAITIDPSNPATWHTFVVDMAKVQQVNYVAISTRAQSNSYIKDYDLYLSKVNEKGETLTTDGGSVLADGSNVVYDLIESGNPNEYLKEYSGYTITKKITTRESRFIKLVVKQTTGGKFSVLTEINAGIQTPTQKLVTSTSSKLFTTNGWVQSSTLDDEPTVYIVSNKKNEKAVIRFVGTNISLYGATGEGFGEITVKVDGKKVATKSLNTKEYSARELLVLAENLEEDKEHTMEIITNNSGKVMLNVIGLPYSANLVNAPNIYFERDLITALIVFVSLFVASFILIMCLLFLPRFRRFMGGNPVIRWLDRTIANGKEKRKLRREKRKEKKAAKLAKQKEAGNVVIRQHERPTPQQSKPNAQPTQQNKASAVNAKPAPTPTKAPIPQKPAQNAKTVAPQKPVASAKTVAPQKPVAQQKPVASSKPTPTNAKPVAKPTAPQKPTAQPTKSTPQKPNGTKPTTKK